MPQRGRKRSFWGGNSPKNVPRHSDEAFFFLKNSSVGSQEQTHETARQVTPASAF